MYASAGWSRRVASHASQTGLEVTFRVTDGNRTLPVRYTGILPDLFREEQGVVAEGSLEESVFNATTVLAKHDENYMPREAAAAFEAYKVSEPK